MRSFIKLSRSESNSLNKNFPEILNLANLEKVDSYHQYALSVFDHWLSPEEARAEIDDISSGREEMHNKNLFKFLLDLSGETNTYLVKFVGRRKSEITFRKFLSLEGLEKHLEPKNHLVSDSFRFVLLFPELETVYFEGCDFTHHFFRKRNAEKGLLEKTAKSNNLYVLK